MTEKFTCVIEKIMDEAYPWRKTKHRNTDDPWIDDVRKNVRKRKKIFAKEGCSVKWKEAKKRTDLMIQRRKKKHYTKFQEIAKNTCDPALYYKIVNRLKDTEKPDKFDIMLMRPEKQVPQVAKELADFSEESLTDFPLYKMTRYQMTINMKK